MGEVSHNSTMKPKAVRLGSRSAAKILELREDANFLLTTILWGNVGINVLLTLLSNSVMLGVLVATHAVHAHIRPLGQGHQ